MTHFIKRKYFAIQNMYALVLNVKVIILNTKHVSNKKINSIVILQQVFQPTGFRPTTSPLS